MCVKILRKHTLQSFFFEIKIPVQRQSEKKNNFYWISADNSFQSSTKNEIIKGNIVHVLSCAYLPIPALSSLLSTFFMSQRYANLSAFSIYSELNSTIYSDVVISQYYGGVDTGCYKG